MEIPEYNFELIPRIRNTEYWPYARFIPVLSDVALEILKEKGVIELKQDKDGEEVMIILIKNKCYEIPKILTSKKSLYWLGFTKERVDKLWDSLVKVSPPCTTPSIIDGGAWAFWLEIKLWIGDEIYAITKKKSDKKDDLWNNKILNDRIGLNDLSRLKKLKILPRSKNADMYSPPIYTYIQEQKPQDLLPLVQRYIYYRWNLLSQLNKVVLYHSSSYFYSSLEPSGKDDCLKFLLDQFEMNPIDLDFMYGRRVIWDRVEWCSPKQN